MENQVLSGIYLLRLENGSVKLGRSVDIHRRRAEWQAAFGIEVDLVRHWPMSRRLAELVEVEAHRILDGLRLEIQGHREIYDADPEIVASAVAVALAAVSRQSVPSAIASNSGDYRASLPYGKWICGDGREVLFNRRYQPLWERRGGKVARADPNERVSPIIAQSFFYNDGDTDAARVKAAKAAYAEWRL